MFDLEGLKVAINLDLDNFEREGKEFEKGIGRLAKVTENLGKGLTQYVTAPLGLLGVASLKVAGDMQALETGFKAVYKGAGDVGLEIQKTLAVAKLPGLGLQEALQGATNLQAAGFSADQARASLLAFGNALATVGKGKAELDRVVLALTQLSNSSKISQQDLNQLKEVLPQLGTVLKSSFNGAANAADLRKLGITGRELVATLTDEFGKLPKVTGGINNAFENLSDSGVLALEKIGNAINTSFDVEGKFAELGDLLTGLAIDFASLDPETQKLAVTLAGLAAATGPVLVGIGALVPAISKGIDSVVLMSSAMGELAVAMGPVGIAAAVLAAGIAYLVITNKSATDEFKQAAKSADDLAGQLNPLLARYEELSKKTKLTADEQQNLKETIQRIGEVTPGAITATDEYGKAMRISTGDAKEYLKALNNIAKAKAQTALPEAQSNFDDLTGRLKKYQEQLDKLNKQRVIVQPKFNSQGIQLPDETITAQSDAGIKLRKDLSESINLTKLAQLKALAEVNKIRQTIGLVALKTDEGKQADAEAEAQKKKQRVITDSLEALEKERKTLIESRAKLSEEIDSAEIARINIKLEANQKEQDAIKALGVGTKGQKKDLDELTKAAEAFHDGLRQVNAEAKIQGAAYDVAGEKAKVYKTYMDKLIELDKTGKVEQSAKFQAAAQGYADLTAASEKFKRDGKISADFTDTETAIENVAARIESVGNYADDAKEQVRVLEEQMKLALSGVQKLKDDGAAPNDAFLIAEQQQADELTAKLVQARVALKDAKNAQSLANIRKDVDGTGEPKQQQNFFDIAGANADLRDLQDRLSDARRNLKDLQQNGADVSSINEAKDAIADLKEELDLSDVFAQATESAINGLADIGAAVGAGIAGVISGQQSGADALKTVFAATLGVIGEFVTQFGKKLILIGIGDIALGNYLKGGLEVAAGIALVAAGGLASAGAGAISGGGGGGSSPTTSPSSAYSPNSSSGTKQTVKVEVVLAPVDFRIDGPQMRAFGQLDKTRMRQR